MKKYLIEYYVGLASFLDEQDIKWQKVNDNCIYIYCDDDTALFTIARDYERFVISLETD